MAPGFYPSLRAPTRPQEKNGASIPFPQLLFGNLLLVVLEGGLLSGVLSGHAPLQLLVGATWAVAGGVTLGLARWLEFPSWPALGPFLGSLTLAWAMIRSGVLALVRGGVLWRGMYYPTSTVRAGRGCGSKRGGGNRAHCRPIYTP